MAVPRFNKALASPGAPGIWGGATPATPSRRKSHCLPVGLQDHPVSHGRPTCGRLVPVADPSAEWIRRLMKPRSPASCLYLTVRTGHSARLLTFHETLPISRPRI